VYETHVYGPSVVPHEPYFSDANFPWNMPAIWEFHWGYVEDFTDNAVVIGEWGGWYEGKDREWQNALADYLLARCVNDNIYWGALMDGARMFDGVVTISLRAFVRSVESQLCRHRRDPPG
jgi:hypothetical protein